MTRRTFAGMAALAAAAPATLKIGIGTYSYHGLSMEAMIVQLQDLGIEEVEMSRGEFMLLSHPGDALFRAARSLLDQAGIRCVSYYSATIHDDAEIEMAIRWALRLVDADITPRPLPAR